MGGKRQNTKCRDVDQASGAGGRLCVKGQGSTQPRGEAVLTLKMKKSSMNMAPKGRIPAMRMLQQKGSVNAARRPRPLPGGEKDSAHAAAVALVVWHAFVPIQPPERVARWASLSPFY